MVVQVLGRHDAGVRHLPGSYVQRGDLRRVVGVQPAGSITARSWCSGPRCASVSYGPPASIRSVVDIAVRLETGPLVEAARPRIVLEHPEPDLGEPGVGQVRRRPTSSAPARRRSTSAPGRRRSRTPRRRRGSGSARHRPAGTRPTDAKPTIVAVVIGHVTFRSAAICRQMICRQRLRSAAVVHRVQVTGREKSGVRRLPAADVHARDRRRRRRVGRPYHHADLPTRRRRLGRAIGLCRTGRDYRRARWRRCPMAQARPDRARRPGLHRPAPDRGDQRAPPAPGARAGSACSRSTRSTCCSGPTTCRCTAGSGPIRPSCWTGPPTASPGALFEYWGHEASLLPVELYPLMRWRMDATTSGAVWSGSRCRAARADRVGPRRGRGSTARSRPPRWRPTCRGARGNWGWNWSDAKAPGVAVLARRGAGQRPEHRLRPALRPARAGAAAGGAGDCRRLPRPTRTGRWSGSRPGRWAWPPRPSCATTSGCRPPVRGQAIARAGRRRRADPGRRSTAMRRPVRTCTRRRDPARVRRRRWSARSIRWSGTAAAPSGCSTSTTGSRSTCRRRSASTATTCCRSCSATGCVARVDLKADRKAGVLRVPGAFAEPGRAAAHRERAGGRTACAWPGGSGWRSVEPPVRGDLARRGGATLRIRSHDSAGGHGRRDA